MLTFADSEPLRALEAITAERPTIIALERLFAASPRGAALIARIKSDPALDGSEIRILSHDSDYQRISPRRRALPPPRAARPSPALDPGTRRAPRFPMQESAEASIDGSPVRLVDLSVLGAQIVGPESVRARQDVTVRLGPESSGLDLRATVVWSRIELSRKGPAARFGVEFADPDKAAIGDFLEVHRRA